METPMVLFPAGRTLEMRSMEAGREIALHERKSTAPRITATQCGMRMTSMKPARATRLKTARAFL
jgi:hypothetical protein